MTELQQSQPQLLVLQNSAQRLRLVPSLGGAVASWHIANPSEYINILRPFHFAAEPQVGAFPMVPWVNRISAGGFQFDDNYYPMAPNHRIHEPPIHGTGWLLPWMVAECSDHFASLELQSNGHFGYPFAFRAKQTFRLDGNDLYYELSVRNDGAIRLPFGLGFHPYFVRPSGTTLQLPCAQAWSCAKDKIPIAPQEIPAAWDYSSAREIAVAETIDHNFCGWSGCAHIEWPSLGVKLSMTQAAPAANYCIVYMPQTKAFFCIEPSTHLADAHNKPLRHGLVALNHGEAMTLQLHFVAQAIG